MKMQTIKERIVKELLTDEELLADVLEQMDDYDSYLKGARWYELDLLDEFMPATELLQKNAYGYLKGDHNYFRFDFYGDLEGEYTRNYLDDIYLEDVANDIINSIIDDFDKYDLISSFEFLEGIANELHSM